MHIHIIHTHLYTLHTIQWALSLITANSHIHTHSIDIRSNDARSRPYARDSRIHKHCSHSLSLILFLCVSLSLSVWFPVFSFISFVHNSLTVCGSIQPVYIHVYVWGAYRHTPNKRAHDQRADSMYVYVCLKGEMRESSIMCVQFFVWWRKKRHNAHTVHSARWSQCCTESNMAAFVAIESK